MPDRPIPLGPRRMDSNTPEDAVALELAKTIVKLFALRVPESNAGSPNAEHLGYLTLEQVAPLFNKSTKAFVSMEQRDPEIRALRARAPANADKRRQPRLYSKRRVYEYLEKI